jgi:hypothetical protein
MKAIYRLILLAAGLLLAAAGLQAQSNFTQLYPGISFAGMQSDLQNVQSNTNYVPTNLLALVSSNYFGVLPRFTVWTFDASTQTGESNGTMTALGQMLSAPVLPVQVFLPPADLGSGFTLGFATASSHSYTVYGATNLPAAIWTNLAHITGNGFTHNLSFPTTNADQFFRVSQP